MDQSRQRKRHWYSSRALIISIIIGQFLCLGCVNKHVTPKQGIYISESECDFGIIADSVNELRHTFYIVNTTNDTCQIENIVKSCGCTDVDIKSEVVNPHDSVMFSVKLNVGSNYSFIEKVVNIYLKGQEYPLTLYLRAIREVPPVLIKEEFPFKLSQDLKLSAGSALLGYVEYGKDKEYSINVINTSNEKRRLSLVSVLPEGYDVIYPKKISPQEISRIVFTCKLEKPVFGEISFDCIFKVDGEIATPINVYSIATERFGRRRMTNPRVCIPITAYDEKVLAKNSIVTFNIINVGNDTLKIRNIQCNSPKVNVLCKKTYSLPLDTCKIIIKMKDNTCLLNDDIVIGVTTNDRIEPFRQLRIVKSNML